MDENFRKELSDMYVQGFKMGFREGYTEAVTYESYKRVKAKKEEDAKDTYNKGLQFLSNLAMGYGITAQTPEIENTYEETITVEK